MLRLAIRVRRDQAEIVLAELLELAPSGVEEIDRGGDAVEYAVYGSPGELPALPDLTAAAGGALIEVSTREVADDWDRRWREFHRPLVLDGRLTVRPPWEPAADTPIDIVIDPGQAFGTGAHATTRLCLELLLELADWGPGATRGGLARGDSPAARGERARGEARAARGELARGEARGELVDLGCGSGVLAIAAARLGFAPVLGLDNDPASLAATVENARRNGVDVQVARHDLRSDAPGTGATVAANLLGPLLTAWAKRLGAVAPARLPERVIASGLLAHEADDVAGAFSPLGLAERERRLHAEWAALLLARDAD